MTPEEIAKSLTKAQRDFFLSLPAYAASYYKPVQNLKALGLIRQPLDCRRWNFTHLGIAVRAAIKEGKK